MDDAAGAAGVKAKIHENAARKITEVYVGPFPQHYLPHLAALFSLPFQDYTARARRRA